VKGSAMCLAAPSAMSCQGPGPCPICWCAQLALSAKTVPAVTVLHAAAASAVAIVAGKAPYVPTICSSTPSWIEGQIFLARAGAFCLSGSAETPPAARASHVISAFAVVVVAGKASYVPPDCSSISSWIACHKFPARAGSFRAAAVAPRRAMEGERPVCQALAEGPCPAIAAGPYPTIASAAATSSVATTSEGRPIVCPPHNVVCVC
jgi:hypothetical protein